MRKLDSLKSLLSSKILEKGRPQYPIAFLNSLKVYSLPKVQYRSKKFKLTALEGSLIRKAIFGRFSIQDKPFYSLMTLTNQGEIILFNLDSEKQIILDKRFFIPSIIFQKFTSLLDTSVSTKKTQWDYFTQISCRMDKGFISYHPPSFKDSVQIVGYL